MDDVTVDGDWMIYTDCCEKVGQNVLYYELSQYKGTVPVKIEIRTDPYQRSNNQGHAKVSVWLNGHWETVLFIDGALMSTRETLAYSGDPESYEKYMAADKLRLRNAVEFVLGK